MYRAGVVTGSTVTMKLAAVTGLEGAWSRVTTRPLATSWSSVMMSSLAQLMLSTWMACRVAVGMRSVSGRNSCRQSSTVVRTGFVTLPPNISSMVVEWRHASGAR